MSQAKRLGVSNTKGLLAVIIGFAWLVPAIFAVVMVAISSTGTSSGAPNAAAPAASSFTPSETQAPPPDKPGSAEQAQEKLRDLGFKCNITNAEAFIGQCTKGTRMDEVYGETDLEFVNFFPSDGDGVYVEGFVFPETASALKKFGIKSLGDDGTGIGTVMIASKEQ